MACAAETAGGHSAAPRPNVLLLLVDDLKPSFRAYGASWVHSPNLDRLAARGLRFDRAYCNQAVCAPSRNNLLLGSRSTSLGLYSLGANFRRAEPEAVTVMQHFMKHGWRAEGIGKVFHVGHGNTNDPASWSVPFLPDKVIDYVLPESTRGQLTREEAYFSNQQLGRNHALPRGVAWEKADVRDDAYADGRIAREGIKRLQQAKRRSEPFLLALGFTKPHLPFCAPTRYWDLYDPAKLPMPKVLTPPAGAPAYAGKTLGELNQYKPIPQNPPVSGDHVRTLVHGYYAALSYMDAQVGLVLDELDRLNLSSNTIVVLWGDHGYHLGDHGMWTKHTNYEEANRIPLVVVAPGVAQPGTVTQALVETVDLYPTLAELAGLPSPIGPQPIDGKSLVPLLKDPAHTVRDHAYHVFPRSVQGKELFGRAIRTERYRMVEWKEIGAPAGSADYELYDYLDDPQETENRAGKHPEVLAQLKAILSRHPEAKPPVEWRERTRAAP
ncbi:MAG TPA: sulfatase [Verrucomicrobiota bacterium]|nr:sulfatase [Verrucomicrobiota bacterium]HNU49706.1 sulfatase [Verrucomicrobiota bacterium]